MRLKNETRYICAIIQKKIKMKAIVYKQYGAPDVLQLKEVVKPTLKDKEVLIKIKATAVNSGDLRLRKADPFAVRLFFGLVKPKINILGSVFSGQIDSIGKDVKLFKVGDEVFGHTDMSFGAYAEYKNLSENGSLALKPSSITYKEAAVIPFGGATALYWIKKVNIKKGQKILINGASGAVGTAAVQIAKYFGANVTGICSTENLDLVKSIGADKVIDYTKEDFSVDGESYDIIFDTVNKLSIDQCIKSLNKNGSLILSAAGMSEMLKGLRIKMTSSIKVFTGVISHNAEDINFLRKLIESGNLKPVIDKVYSLEQIAEAHTYVEKGHKKGNVAIEIKED